MAPVDLPFLYRKRVKGHAYVYYRRHGSLTRLPAEADKLAFLAAWQAAHALGEAAAHQGGATSDAPLPGSMRALVLAYRASAEWQDLAPATRVDYDKALTPLAGPRYGHLPVATMPRQFVFKLRDDFASMPAFTRHKVPAPIVDADGRQLVLATPRRANRMVNVLRLLLSWAHDRGGWLRGANPALRPGRLRTSGHYRRWTDVDFAMFMACDAVAEELKRAAALGLYTGQRKQDCLAMTRSARRAGVIEVTPEKTRRSTAVRLAIPEHPELRRILDAAPRSDAVTILTRKDGLAWREDHFNHAFAKAVKAAGLAGLSFHGLRKAASARMAEAGCTDAEIEAIVDHADARMTRLYREQADQKTRATAAIRKLVRTKR